MTTIEQIEIKVAVIEQKVTAIEKKLFGNGVKGMISRMDDVLEWINKEKGEKEANKGLENWSRKKLIVILSAVVAPILVAICFYAFKFHLGG